MDSRSSLWRAYMISAKMWQLRYHAHDKEMKITFRTFALCMVFIFLGGTRIIPQGGGAEKSKTPPTKTSTPKTTSKKSTPPVRTVQRTPTTTTRGDGGDNATAVELAFWNSIKESTNPDDYRAYLKRYPSGQFAEIAQNKIHALEAADAERRFWENIKNSANPEDLRAYLNKYPNGIYADAARNQIDTLERATKEEAARKEEARKAEAKRKEVEATKRAGAVVKNSVGIELVYVPPGSFMMGSETGESDEKPVHRVSIGNGFYMGKYEITQAEWQAVMGNNPSFFKGCDNCPVEQVSRDDAIAFIARLNAQNDGFTYRLPTEAEWEYACRAGTTTDFAFGDSINSAQANFDGNFPYGKAAKGVYRKKTTPVGSFQPNAFGLYDMHGNVWEWCQDEYHDNYNGAPTDGSAWMSDRPRVFWLSRGGDWYYHGRNVRSANRQFNGVEHSRDYFGYSPTESIGIRLVAIR